MSLSERRQGGMEWAEGFLVVKIGMVSFSGEGRGYGLGFRGRKICPCLKEGRVAEMEGMFVGRMVSFSEEGKYVLV